MIAILIYIFVAWLAWRLLCRWTASQCAEIAPPPPTTITINVYMISRNGKEG
jgi:hypothetical protein